MAFRPWKSAAVAVVQVVGILLFVTGFFPSKPAETGFNNEAINVPHKFERMVFMIVDALRSDLIFEENAQWPTVHALIRGGHALPFTAYSDPPTVTMPRLKGLTTGSMPNFLDAILNIAESDTSSSLVNYDSWVGQMKRKGKILKLFGDNTWLKLFPDTFEEADGTSSFFVSDYEEVDLNVTRHLPSQLSSRNWDAMILHFLGMDHIGHKSGPRSPLMRAKQLQMDEVVRNIFESMDNSTLLVLAGDHGMNEVGNHGGSSIGETSAALLLVSSAFREPKDAPLPSTPNFKYYNSVSQVDLVPTISFLMGLPVPKNNVGIVIPQLLELWDAAAQQRILEYHCSRIGIVESCTWPNVTETQRDRNQDSTEYNLTRMLAGIMILGICSVYALCKVWQIKSEDRFIASAIGLLYMGIMFGSSTIEEEHYFWYWSFGSLVALGYLRAPNLRWVLMLVVFRLARGFHHCGQKWVIGVSTGQWLAAHPAILWLLVFITYLHFASFRNALPLFASFCFKVSEAYYGGERLPSVLIPLIVPVKWLPWLPRFVFLFSAILCLFGKKLSALCVILLLQSRTVNSPLLVLYDILLDLVGRQPYSSQIFKSQLLLVLQFAFFFIAGGSNSLATIDLVNAYNGVGSYNVPAVTILTYVGNWIGPIFSAASALTTRVDIKVHFCTLQWVYSAAVLGITAACYVLRAHLFVWTVFSPKLLYVGAWLAFQHLLSDHLLVCIE